MQDLAIGRKARIQTPDSVILVEKDDTQHEGAVAKIKEWLALIKDEADALEDVASSDLFRGKLALGKKTAAWQGDGDATTEKDEQAKANEDIGNPVGDEEEEEEELDGEEEEDDTGADNTSGEDKDEDDDDGEEEEESDEEEGEEQGDDSSEEADSEEGDDTSSDGDDDPLSD
eukprot:jgi/Tetstr1/433824/TSEL_023010.t1